MITNKLAPRFTCRKGYRAGEYLTNQKPKAVFVDKGYRGVGVDGVTIWLTDQK